MIEKQCIFCCGKYEEAWPLINVIFIQVRNVLEQTNAMMEIFINLSNPLSFFVWFIVAFKNSRIFLQFILLIELDRCTIWLIWMEFSETGLQSKEKIQKILSNCLFTGKTLT